MKKLVLVVSVFIAALTLYGCGETWSCETNGKSMYSKSSSGQIGGASKGCSCEKIRSFELKQSGELDEQALKKDFGC
jgi:outer membrane lipoprotein SlyB